MSEHTTRFTRLTELAKETSSEKRRELLREVTDLFLEAAPDYSDVERTHFGAILGQVAEEMETAVRRQLARQLADVPSAPHSLISQLANDEFSVAEEVLTRSSVLGDADLVAIVDRGEQRKLGAIARRETVSEVVSHALVEMGDDTVVSELVTNAGAKISHQTFQRVVERSETSAILQGPLVARADLPLDLLHDMFSFVSGELRTKISQTLDDLPEGMLEAAFQTAARGFANEVRQVKDADRKAMVFTAEMARKKMLNEALLHQLVRNEQTTEFIHVLARLADIEVKTVRQIVNARNLEGIAIICKAMRFDLSTFSAISFFLERATGGEVTQELVNHYDKVTAEAAQRAIRFWRVRREAGEATAQPLAQAS
jgi:uncharacterized protein (DUF2336 family)